MAAQERARADEEGLRGTVPGDLDVLLRGLRAAAAWKVRRMAAAGILFTVSLLTLLLVLFPAGPGAVAEPLQAVVGNLGAADVGGSRLSVLAGLLAGRRQQVEEGRLAGLGEAQDADLHELVRPGSRG